jgi:hypothetical protein
LRGAENAVADNNRVKVTPSPDFAGSIKNEMEVGKGAHATGNDVGVSFTDSSDPLPPG